MIKFIVIILFYLLKDAEASPSFSVEAVDSGRKTIRNRVSEVYLNKEMLQRNLIQLERDCNEVEVDPDTFEEDQKKIKLMEKRVSLVERQAQELENELADLREIDESLAAVLK